ncbi:MAG: hypothetical protein ACOX2F_06735 [bacterium]
MLNKILNAVFGGDADEVHLFGNSFKEMIGEGVEIIIEGVEDIAESFDSFDNCFSDEEESDSKEDDEEVELN